MKSVKTKFILTTKTLFLISFFLFSIMSFFVITGNIFLSKRFDSGIILFDSGITLFFVSFTFYTFMPIIRFISNYKKIKTEDEKKSVSGFYIRYFGGFFVSLILILIFYPLNIGGLDSFFISGIIGLFIFYIFSIITLYEK